MRLAPPSQLSVPSSDGKPRKAPAETQRMASAPTSLLEMKLKRGAAPKNPGILLPRDRALWKNVDVPAVQLCSRPVLCIPWNPVLP